MKPQISRKILESIEKRIKCLFDKVENEVLRIENIKDRYARRFDTATNLNNHLSSAEREWILVDAKTELEQMIDDLKDIY